MAEGGRGLASIAYASSGSSFLPWLNRSPKRFSEPGGRKASTKPGGADEDTKSWAGFERWHHVTPQPKGPLATKGPAFWSHAATTQQRKVRARSARSSWLQLHFVDHCMCPRLRKVVYGLVVLALTLFFTLMCLISAYVTTANNTDEVLLKLGGQQRRLVEAVKNLARGQRMKCEACQSSWMQMAGACYLFTTVQMSWQKCVDYCRARKSSLLMARTEAEVTQLPDLLFQGGEQCRKRSITLMLESRKRVAIQNKRPVPAHYWIGLMYNSTVKSWFWAHGAHLHIKLSVIDKTPYLLEDLCVLFHNGHQDIRRCSYKNCCLCKREAGPLD